MVYGQQGISVTSADKSAVVELLDNLKPTRCASLDVHSHHTAAVSITEHDVLSFMSRPAQVSRTTATAGTIAVGPTVA